MKRVWWVAALAGVVGSGCKDVDCGDFLMLDEATGRCVCPDGTEVDPETSTCRTVDAGGDSGGSDGGADAGVDAAAPECVSVSECPDRANATKSCDGGRCAYECAADWGDCDGDGATGCETDLTSADAHCGMCGNLCEDAVCIDRECRDAVVDVCTGFTHNCALRASGTVACWGSNSVGELGDGSFDDSGTPVDVLGLRDITDIDCGMASFSGPRRATSCALQSDGAVFCWGQGARGTNGDGTFETRNSPVRVLELSQATSITVGSTFVCAAETTGRVKCWGEVGGANRNLPLLLPGGFVGRRVSGNCWVGDSRELACWDMDFMPAPTGLVDIAGLAGGWEHVCAARTDGTIFCSGSNRFGQLGTDLPLADRREEFVQVQGPLRATRVHGHANTTCAVEDDGSAFCWGGDHTQPFEAVPVRQATPTRLTALPPVRSIDAGAFHSCAALRTGEVACWGLQRGLALGPEVEPDAHTGTPVVIPSLP